MDRSPDRMDLDVWGDDGRETAWWKRLTTDSVRTRELVGKLNPACFPIDARRACREVDITLEEVYYDLHPSHARGTPIPNFITARAHTIPVINDISRQNHRNAGGLKGDMGACMSSFLDESYPKSAPFNGEALNSRVSDGTGDRDSVASSHGSSSGLRSDGSSPPRERLRASDCFHSCDSQPHPNPPCGGSTTHTPSVSTKYSPGRSNSGSPGASGGAVSDGCPAADENIISRPLSSTPNRPRRSRIYPPSRSVLNQGHPPNYTGHHFDVPHSRSLGEIGPGGQHKCDQCGKTFPYHSKLKDHAHIHRPDKPLPCNHPGCPKKFKRPRELQAHKKTHDAKIPRSLVQPLAIPSPPPQHTPGPPGHGGYSPKSEPSDLDRAPPASPDVCTLSGSPYPPSSRIGGLVATSEPSVVNEREEERTEHKLPPGLHATLDRQLFPELPQLKLGD